MTPIRTAVLTLAAAAALLVAAKCAFGAECLPSAEAVWASHPGTKWATRHTSHGERCWEAGRYHHRKEVMQLAGQHRRSASRSLRTIEMRSPSATAAVIPVPREKPWKLVLFNDFMDHIVFGEFSQRH